MDVPAQLAALLDPATGTTLSETVDPLFRTVGGGASLGIALLCVWEAGREEPRWDRAAGLGAAVGAMIGSAVLLYDALTT